MKILTQFEFNPLNSNDYTKLMEPVELHSQDPTHIGTKLRNRLLKPSILIPLGNKQVSVGHLKMLIEMVPKGVHGLILKDICPDDRQNFGSLEKVMQPIVTKSLEKYIFDSVSSASSM